MNEIPIVIIIIQTKNTNTTTTTTTKKGQSRIIEIIKNSDIINKNERKT